MTITHSRTNCRNSVSSTSRHTATMLARLVADVRPRTMMLPHDCPWAPSATHAYYPCPILPYQIYYFFYRRHASRTRPFLSLHENKHATLIIVVDLFRPATFEYSSSFATANVPAKKINDNGLRIKCHVKKYKNNMSV